MTIMKSRMLTNCTAATRRTSVNSDVSRRLVVLDASEEEDVTRPLILINPQIVTLGAEKRVYEEGCLSIPDVKVEIERPSTLTVRFLDRDGKAQELAAVGLLATAIQQASPIAVSSWLGAWGVTQLGGQLFTNLPPPGSAAVNPSANTPTG